MNDASQLEMKSMTRRERRELRRQERRQQQRGQQQRHSMKRVLVWGIAVIVVAAVGWLAWRAAKSVPSSEGTTLAVPVTENDHVLGPADAPVTLVEYADFQCPGCAAFHPVIQQTLEDPALAGNVRFVFRYFPLTNIHAHADLAARAAEAAALQGKFWEMHDRIFEGQGTWSAKSESDAQKIFAGYAQELGLDVTQWQEDLDSNVVADHVRADEDSARASSVNSTPSFFVNGTYADVFATSDAVSAFRQALLNALNASP